MISDWRIKLTTHSGYHLHNRSANITLVGPRFAVQKADRVGFYVFHPNLATDERLQAVRELLPSCELAEGRDDFLFISETDVAIIRLFSE